MLRFFLILFGILFSIFTQDAQAAPLIPSVNVEIGEAETPDEVATTMQMFALLTIISFAPGILMMTTSFVRIVVVIGFLRNASRRIKS